MNYISIKKLGLVILITLSITNSIAFSANDTPSTTPSAGNYTVLAPLPCIEGNGIKCGSGGNGSLQETVTFETYVQYTMNLLIALAAVWAVVMIVWAGIGYMVTTTVSGKGASLSRFWNAIWGIVLILCSYLIMRTIDPRFVEIPNTLVPTIQLKNISRSSSGIDLLMIGLNKDIAELQERDIELKKSLEDVKTNLIVQREELANIRKQISEKITLGASPNSPEIQKLQVEEQNKLNSIIKKESEGIIKIVQTDFDRTLINSRESITEKTSVPQTLSKLETDKLVIEEKKNNYIKNPSQIIGRQNPSTTKEISERASIAKAEIDLLKIDLVLANIKTNATSVYNLDGRSRINDDAGARRIKKEIESVIASIKNDVVSKTTDSFEKTKLIEHINNTEKSVSEVRKFQGLK